MIQKPKGTRDFLPKQAEEARLSEDLFVHWVKRYGFQEIRYPTFEKTELFERGVGETTDVVQKEMFRVISAANLVKYKENQYDIEKEGLTLRPEGTACVVRSFIENKLYAEAQPGKYFYMGSHFRNERPQAGRFREFTQYGVEVFGSDHPYTDAEVMALAVDVIRAHGIPAFSLRINSVGCPQCRPIYHQALRHFLADKKEDLCYDCQQRYDKNPLRVLDCKIPADQEKIQGHPTMLKYLCPECQEHFQAVKKQLEAMEIPYEVDPGIVRGLDYYVRTAFEITGGNFGTQNTLCGGGRYDGLVKNLEGPDLPGIGFGMGMDRLIMVAREFRQEEAYPPREGIFLVPMGSSASLVATRLLRQLLLAGFYVQCEVTGRSLKSALKYADKRNFRHLLILGDEELEQQSILLKDLQESTQKLLLLEDVVEEMENYR